MEYNPSKLLKELKAAGLPVEGTDSDGNIRWVQDPTVNEVAAAGSVKAAHNPIEIIPQPVDIYADLLKALTPETNGEFDFEVATAIATWVTNSPAAMLWVTPALNRKSGVLDIEMLKRAKAFIEHEIASEKLPESAGAKLVEILGGLIGV